MHTPAPWIVGDEANPLIFADGAYVAQVLMYSDGETGSLRPTAAADARLIASAPDLLAALQALAIVAESVAHLRGLEREILPAADAARAAIAKATGA